VIFEAGTPDFAKADLIAVAPSSGAGTGANEPLNFPRSADAFPLDEAV